MAILYHPLGDMSTHKSLNGRYYFFNRQTSDPRRFFLYKQLHRNQNSPISAKGISLQIKLQNQNLRIYEITKLHRNYIFVMPVFPLFINSINVYYKITLLIKDSNNREFRQYIYPSKSSNAHIRAFIRAHPRARVRARAVFRGFKIRPSGLTGQV